MSNKAQIICIGASSLYGVGGTQGGWGDYLKRELHLQMYKSGGYGEGSEVYNLAAPGATLLDMLPRLKPEIRARKKAGRETIIILHLGSNDTKAVGKPDNYISSYEEYQKLAHEFLSVVKSLSSNVLCLGMTPMDETKTMPKVNPLTGDGSYFTNERIQKFEKCLAGSCAALGLAFIPLFEEAKESGWLDEYIFDDGVHPNTRGHKWLFEKVYEKLESIK